MPNVNLVATKSFSYRTRRLQAGDDILDVPARDAKVLTAIGKAEYPRQAGKVAPPPHELIERTQTATPQKATAPAPKSSPPAASTKSTSTARTTRRRRTTRKSAAKKG